MRRLIPAFVLCSSVFSTGASADDIPLTVIGMPFAPESPVPLTPQHPMYHMVEVGEIEGLPASVKSSALNIIAAAKRSSINKGLQETMARMNISAPDGTAAKGHLAVKWVDSDTPFKIGGRNQATATLHYRLTRISNGEVLFEREITTKVEGGGGGNASMRDNGIVRAAIAANFASAAYCLDHAALGTDPDDCALTPKFSVSVQRVYR